MKNSMIFVKKTIQLLPIAALVLLSGCASPTGHGQGWEHVRDNIRENIYTGDDHI